MNRSWWILVAVGVGTIMSALDSSIVNLILPVIRTGLGSDVATIEWAVTIYLLVVSALLLNFGRLGDMRGNRLVYTSGFGIFISGSALCGIAPSATVLILFRGLQAFGAAMIFANAPAILTKNFPPQQRGQVLGLQGMMTYLGLSIGPTIGGWLTNQLGWRYVFFINVPVGLLALFLSLRFIPSDPPNPNVEPFDAPGAITFSSGLVALLLALNQGHAWGWTSPMTIGVFGAAVILLTLFVIVESRVASPMLDLNLFRNRLFSASASSALLNYASIYSITFLLPFYLMQGRGLNPAQAGLLLTAQPLIMAITAPVSGTLSDRIGSRLPSMVGMILVTVGLFILSRLGLDSPFGNVVLGLAVAGLGVGIFVSPNNSALMGSAPRQRQGVASGIMATSRNVGMVLGIGLSGAIFTTVLAQDPGVANPLLLFDAIHVGFLAATGVALLTVFTSAIRGG